MWPYDYSIHNCCGMTLGSKGLEANTHQLYIIRYISQIRWEAIKRAYVFELSVHPCVCECLYVCPFNFMSPDRYYSETKSQIIASKYRWNWWHWQGHWFKGQGQPVVTEITFLNAVARERMDSNHTLHKHFL